ncbi:MAG: hypothetical protein AAGF11_03830 [Myxococcota bacterium]
MSTGDRLYATHQSAIASGASVLAVDLASGHVLWTRPDLRFCQRQWEGKAPDAPFDFTRGPSELAIDDTHDVVTNPEGSEHPATLERIDIQ